jgi:ABC-2 type transport system ATP-binding protein
VLRPDPEEDLVLRVTVESEQLLEDWVVGISIETHTGQQLFGTNTQLLGVRLDPLLGRRDVDIRLSGLRLGEGQYHVVGALAEWEGVTFNMLHAAARLEVGGNGRAVGPVGVSAMSAEQVERPAVASTS